MIKYHEPLLMSMITIIYHFPPLYTIANHYQAWGPLNHPFIDGIFPEINQPSMGVPPLWKPIQ